MRTGNWYSPILFLLEAPARLIQCEEQEHFNSTHICSVCTRMSEHFSIVLRLVKKQAKVGVDLLGGVDMNETNSSDKALDSDAS